MNRKSFVKGIFIIFVLIFALFIFNGCKVEVSNDEVSIELTADVDSVSIGDEIQVYAKSNKFGNYEFQTSDKSIATVDEDGYVKGVKEGTVTISAYLTSYPDVVATIDITVTSAKINSVKVSGTKAGKPGDVITLSYSVSPRGIDVTGTYENLNPELVSIKQTNNSCEITLLNEGVATININFDDVSNYSYTFNVGIFTYDDIVVDSEKQAEDGEIVEYNAKTYYYGYTYLSNMKDACNYIIDNGTITVLKGNYDKDAVLNSNNVSILGVNKDLNPVENKFTNNSTITNSIVVNKDITGTVIKGLTFNGDGMIYFTGNNDDTLIANCLFDSCTTTQSWRKQSSVACIYLDSNTSCYDDVTIIQNKFINISTNGVAFNYANNIKITDNYFKDFTLDAIHANGTEVLESSQWLIRNNTFINGGYNGIYLYGYGPKLVSYDSVISIFDNSFENIGNEHTDNVYYGAISLDSYNGGTCSVTIRYNEFKDCLANVKIDSAVEDKYVKNLSANINYNLFNSDNINYYFSNETDNISYSANEIANLDYNVYIKNDLKTTIDATKYSTGYTSLQNNISYSDFVNLEKVYGTNTLYKESESKYIALVDNVKWTSSDTSVVTIDSDGKATAISQGSAVISAYQNTKLLATYDVTVKDPINIDYASLIVQIALGEEGYHEGSNNYTKYGVWYGATHGKDYENGAWCAMFVSWCANQANIPTSIIPEYALCSAGRQWFEQRGLFQYKENYTPKTGDIIFFLSNGASHTGIVVDYKNDTVYTIEGNTSDMCAQRNYVPSNARITGYGTPDYPKYNGAKTASFDISSSTDGTGHKTT